MEFFRRCAQTKGGARGPAIQALAQEFGVEISHESANTFRKGALKNYLEELKAKSERAQQVAAFAREGLSMSDAASVRLAETVFDDLMSPDAAGLTAKERDTYSKIIARARLGDQRAQKLEADLKLRDEQLTKLKADAKERDERQAKAKAALERVKAGGGLRKETLKQIEEAVAIL